MNSFSQARRLSAVGVFLIALCGLSFAQSKDEAQIEIRAIRGTTKNNDVSPELKDIAATLQKNMKLTGLKLEKPPFKGQASAKNPYETDLVAGYKSKVIFVERKENRITLEIEVTRPAPPANAPKNEKEKKDDKGKKDEKKKDGDKPVAPAAGPDVFKIKITIDAGGRQNFDFEYPAGGGDKLILSISAK